jgi:3-methyladenine DNA glycosylase AlkD
MSDAMPSPSPALLAEQLLSDLKDRANAENVAGMARFGISSDGTLGVSMPVTRSLARDAKRALGRDRAARHELAALLWDSGVHEARIMAALVDEPSLVTPAQADAWTASLDSWDTCDQLCINLLRCCDFAWEKAEQYASAEAEFTRRAAFALAATLAVHEKSAPDSRFEALLELAVHASTDERNGVKKAVSWAIRGIGKRNAALNTAAIRACKRILAEHPASRSARWIARDALRELESEKVRMRLGVSASGRGGPRPNADGVL